tara:strand:+ start:144 stop:380 length:237 start_codon:yes stop_codon:yes gene_type:complete
MITLKQAKRDLNLRVKALEETIKFLKENAYYEDICKNCHNIMKVKVVKYFTYKDYCGTRCRSQAYEKRKKLNKDNKNV